MNLNSLVLRDTVSFQVSLQVIEACVSLWTQLTGVWSNPCVLHHMFL